MTLIEGVGGLLPHKSKAEIDAFISHLKVFCDTLLPGANFKYEKIDWEKSRGAYRFIYHPNDEHYGAVRVYIPENLLTFRVMQYKRKKWFMPTRWTDLTFSEMYPYNIHLAYKYLDCVGIKPNISALPDSVFV